MRGASGNVEKNAREDSGNVNTRSLGMWSRSVCGVTEARVEEGPQRWPGVVGAKPEQERRVVKEAGGAKEVHRERTLSSSGVFGRRPGLKFYRYRAGRPRRRGRLYYYKAQMT